MAVKKRSRYIPQKVKDAVRLRDMDICQMCGQTSEYMEFDHITPFALGAPSTVENIQQLCRKCNNKKRAKTERKCSDCQGWNAHDAKFCHHCGLAQTYNAVEKKSQRPEWKNKVIKALIIFLALDFLFLIWVFSRGKHR